MAGHNITLILRIKTYRRSEVAQLCMILCDPITCSPPGTSIQGIFPGNSCAAGCHFLLQGISPTQGSNPGLLHCRQTLYLMRHQGSLKSYVENIFKKKIIKDSWKPQDTEKHSQLNLKPPPYVAPLTLAWTLFFVFSWRWYSRWWLDDLWADCLGHFWEFLFV